MLADHILSFFKTLKLREKLPGGVGVMNPYRDKYAFSLCKQFYRKFYADRNPRTVILGINPGRFGGGITGIPFTDPVKLEKYCDIENTLTKKAELSADFIYAMIEELGGPAKFYSRFYVGAVCPLGFTQEQGKNLNYYDLKELQEAVRGFCIRSLKKQLDFGLNRKTAYCLGEGQNFKFLSRLNSEHHFFEKIIPLPHPRFIMQYRRKLVDEFIKQYLDCFKNEKD
jgi:hypothetical protein